MCLTSLLRGPRADLWPFYGILFKPFSLYIKVDQSWLVGHSSEAARLIHRRKTAVNPLQLLQSPPNSALVTHDIVLLSSRYLYIERKPFTEKTI